MFDFDSSYLIYLLVGISIAMFAEGATFCYIATLPIAKTSTGVLR